VTDTAPASGQLMACDKVNAIDQPRKLTARFARRLQRACNDATQWLISFSLDTKENMKKFIVVTILLLNLGGVRAEPSLPAATSPTKVVTDLYTAHKGKADPLQDPASKKLLGAYFEKGLLSLYLKDQAESKGEVGKLEFDPLYAAQDFEIKDFSVALVAQKKDSAEVAASFKNMGKSEKIVFFLSNTAQGWRITDIKYPDGPTLRGILK
jgi:hypothetical protein